MSVETDPNDDLESLRSVPYKTHRANEIIRPDGRVFVFETNLPVPTDHTSERGIQATNRMMLFKELATRDFGIIDTVRAGTDGAGRPQEDTLAYYRNPILDDTSFRDLIAAVNKQYGSAFHTSGVGIEYITQGKPQLIDPQELSTSFDRLLADPTHSDVVAALANQAQR